VVKVVTNDMSEPCRTVPFVFVHASVYIVDGHIWQGEETRLQIQVFQVYNVSKILTSQTLIDVRRSASLE
jgi:hypothetical protein